MQLRKSNIERLQNQTFDILIIGGGINGAVSAASLSSRGAKVALVEKKDFASSTSQESSNLIWGGVKYLENFEFNLVNKLCRSRNQLMKKFPSNVKEIRFLVTHEKSFRKSLFTLYLGSWLYWLFGRASTKVPKIFSKKRLAIMESILNVSKSDGGIEYSDAYLSDNDARFVFCFIKSAIDNGCIAANYLSANSSKFQGNKYKTEVLDKINGKKFTILSKVIINASGPEVDILNKNNKIQTKHRHLLSKGVHLIVKRITDSNKVLTFFADDGRLFFAIPMGSKTCIGTTDTNVEKLPTNATEEDRKFLLENINKRLNLKSLLTKKDIIAEKCGVRPLVIQKGTTNNNTGWIDLSRKHVIEINKDKNYISILGGKLTDCLNIGEKICKLVEKIGINLKYRDRKWYGEPNHEIKKSFFHQAILMNLDRYTSKSSIEPLSQRFWRRYGRDAFILMEYIRQNPKMAETILEEEEYTSGEVKYAAEREMVIKLEDFLRRRSKIALLTPKEKLRKSQDLKEICKVFFGKDAEQAYNEYFD